MKNWKLLIAALILVVGAFLLSQSGQNGGSADPMIGQDLLNAQQIDQVNKIEINHSIGQIVLNKVDKDWVVANKGDFAANLGTIEELFQRLSNTSIIEMVSSNKKRHDKMGVADLAEGAKPKSGSLLLKFSNAQGDAIKTLYLGNTRQPKSPDGSMGFGAQGQYARIDSNDSVYLISEQVWVDSQDLPWLKNELIKLSANQIGKITWQPNEENAPAFSIDREIATAAFVLTNLPEDQQTVKSKADAAAAFFANLSFDGLIAANYSQHESFNNPLIIILNTFDGLELKLIIGEADKSDSNMVMAAVGSSYSGSDATLQARSEEIAANSERFIYQLHTNKLNALKLDYSDLHEPVAGNEQEQELSEKKVSASHILLAWKGAERSSAERTQEEAQKLAEELLEKIKAGESFEGLAEEHSDCPSGKSSKGSLGEFGSGMMAKPFEASAFGLEIGEISEIITTDFGYHIIRRDG